MAREQSATVGDFKDAVLNIVQIANAPGTTRTEMLDSFDQIIEEAEGVYPGALEEASEIEEEEASENVDEEEQ